MYIYIIKGLLQDLLITGFSTFISPRTERITFVRGDFAYFLIYEIESDNKKRAEKSALYRYI